MTQTNTPQLETARDLANRLGVRVTAVIFWTKYYGLYADARSGQIYIDRRTFDAWAKENRHLINRAQIQNTQGVLDL